MPEEAAASTHRGKAGPPGQAGDAGRLDEAVVGGLLAGVHGDQPTLRVHAQRAISTGGGHSGVHRSLLLAGALQPEHAPEVQGRDGLARWMTGFLASF